MDRVEIDASVLVEACHLEHTQTSLGYCCVYMPKLNGFLKMSWLDHFQR